MTLSNITREELVLKLKSLKGDLVENENQIGIQPKNARCYYWFSINGDIVKTDYIYYLSSGKKSYSFTRFWNLLYKLNIN
jgi:hypothetical protein